MKNSVVIKGNKYGIIVVLDKNQDYESLKKDVAEKFKESAKFFGSSDTAVTFSGREMSDDEMKEIVEIIEENSDLKVICIIDKEAEDFKQTVLDKGIVKAAENKGSKLSSKNEESGNDTSESSNDTSKSGNNITDSNDITGNNTTTGDNNSSDSNSSGSGNAEFYTGTLRSGQTLSSNGNIVIIGDVNPGASISANGNIVVLGSLRGTAIAGQNGFVIALELDPIQIRIGEIIATADKNAFKSALKIRDKKKVPQAKIAYVDEDNIYIEDLSKDAINYIISMNR